MDGPRQRLIAPEGWPLIGALALAAAEASWFGGGWATLPLWLAALAAAYLFRDPPRTIPAQPLGVISPADAVVYAIDEVHDPCLERTAVRIRLCMPVTGVYSLRAPIEGKVLQRWQEKLIANLCADGDRNDEFDDYAIWLQSDEKDDILLLLPGGLPLRHPRFYAYAGDRIGQGQRCGFIRFGSRIDLLLPASAKVGVAVGQRVVGGESVLASLVHVKPGEVAAAAT